MPYIGKDASAGNSKISKYQTTVGSGGQTNFTVQIDGGNVVQVFLNGVLLNESDYTQSSTQIALGSAAIENDIVEVHVYRSFNIADAAKVTGDTFTGAVSGPTPTADAHLATKAYVDGQSHVPSQSSHSGKFLTTNGTAASWSTVDALPDQSGHAGQYLKTDGSSSDWATLNPNSVTGAFTATDETIVKLADGLSMTQTTLSGTHEVPTGYQTVMAGPITVSGTLTVNGRLVLV
ncbi:collagen triple helix repeat protein [uncultured Mediterranean phage uvMED]|nr:collagen triple helix repeat protein [uncultured Mediterranean phage uvMED]